MPLSHFRLAPDAAMVASGGGTGINPWLYLYAFRIHGGCMEMIGDGRFRSTGCFLVVVEHGLHAVGDAELGKDAERFARISFYSFSRLFSL